MTERRSIVPSKELVRAVKRREIVTQFAEPIAYHRGVIRNPKATEGEVVDSVHMIRLIDKYHVERAGFGADVFDDAEMMHARERNKRGW